MSDKGWDDDVTKVFSTLRICLEIYGLWPSQTQTVFMKIRWSFCMAAHFMVLPFVLTDFIEDDGEDASASIEGILYFSSTLNGIIKNISFFFGCKKLYMNIDAAVDDWQSVKDDKKAQKIMRKYASKSRTLTLVLLYSMSICLIIYILTIVVINVKQIFFTDPVLMNADTNVTDWIFLIPTGSSLGNSITGSQYVIILSIQIFQVLVVCTTQFIVDSFFFCMAAHLAGQLEILNYKFEVFANEQDTETNCRRKFVDLINRHSELMECNQNLEDVFHVLLLNEFVMVTIMLALLGLRIDLYVSTHDQVGIIKTVMVMNYMLLQALVYTYGADFLQRKSEDIFYALYKTSWFTFPLALMKDLHFAMMRSSSSFHLTGGKFFFVNRETMVYVLKRSCSYVSVLRIALRNHQ